MHTHDRTLLASLGFADKDKRDRRHTLACQYLCQPEVAVRLWSRLYPTFGEAMVLPEVVEMGAPPSEYGSSPPFDHPASCDVMWDGAHTSATTEVGIYRGNGFLVGFWDVVLGATAAGYGWAESVLEYGRPRYTGDHGPPLRRRFTPAPRRLMFGTMRIEVKANYVDVADIARQIEVYQSGTIREIHGERRPIVVATCYTMPPADRETLAAKNIHHVYLGDGFKAYCRSREAETVSEEGGL